MPPKVRSYVLDLNSDRSAVEVLLNLDDDTTTRFALPVGAPASDFIGKLIEQCQFAGEHLPPPDPVRFAEGLYPTFPLRVAFSLIDHPTQGPAPLLVADYGGCELGFAVDAESIAALGPAMVRRVAEERRKRGLPR